MFVRRFCVPVLCAEFLRRFCVPNFCAGFVCRIFAPFLCAEFLRQFCVPNFCVDILKRRRAAKRAAKTSGENEGRKRAAKTSGENKRRKQTATIYSSHQNHAQSPTSHPMLASAHHGQAIDPARHHRCAVRRLRPRRPLRQAIALFHQIHIPHVS